MLETIGMTTFLLVLWIGPYVWAEYKIEALQKAADERSSKD